MNNIWGLYHHCSGVTAISDSPLQAALYSNRGPMSVCIDGTCQTIQNTSPTLQWAVPQTFSGLTDSLHIVEIRSTSSAFIDLDAVEVGGVGGASVDISPIPTTAPQPVPVDPGVQIAQAEAPEVLPVGHWTPH